MSDTEEELRDALHAVLQFCSNEMRWEFFRAEMLHFDDKPRQTATMENARKLQNFLAQPEIKKHLLASERRHDR